MSIVVAFVLAVGVFLLWGASNISNERDLIVRTVIAALGSACIGIVGGRFYAILDLPVVWP